MGQHELPRSSLQPPSIGRDQGVGSTNTNNTLSPAQAVSSISARQSCITVYSSTLTDTLNALNSWQLSVTEYPENVN